MSSHDTSHDSATGEPSVAEIAALTARLRHLSTPAATEAERAAFLADKQALLARIPDHDAEDTATADRTHTDTPAAGTKDGVLDVAAHDDRDGVVDLQLDRDCAAVLGAAMERQIEALGGVEHRPLTAGWNARDAEVYRQAAERAQAAADAYRAGWSGVSPAEMPAVMLDGIEQRSAERGLCDDPVEVAARLDDLRDRAAAAAGTPAGGWCSVGAEQAAHQLVDRGTDLDTARTMVADYLRETSERIGAPAEELGLDQGDLDAIAADHRLPTTLPPVVASAYATAEHDAAEQDRDAQLTRWHADDTMVNRAATASVDDGLADGGGMDDELTDDRAGWSR